MLNDTISDFLTRLRNASLAGKKDVSVRTSKMIKEIAEILKKEGYIAEIKVSEGNFEMTLAEDWPISHIKRLSKPGVRYYVKTTEIPRPRGGTGLVILSTPKGVLTGGQARKQRVGGELICEVW